MAKSKIEKQKYGIPSDAEMQEERQRLAALFSTLPEQRLGAAQTLIDRAAFLTVTIQRLERDMVKAGFSEEYQNGANQTGMKKTPAADLHVSYCRNLLAITKQLAVYLDEAGESEEDDFTRF